MTHGNWEQKIDPESHSFEDTDKPFWLDETTEKEKKVTLEKEFLFNEFIAGELNNAFQNGLEDADISDEHIEQINTELKKYSLREIKAMLAIPFELREQSLRKIKMELQQGKTAHEIVANLDRIAKKYHFSVGYHISKQKISGSTIRATELDDRDDRMMAYYSLDYKNLFRKKRGAYLYIVRISEHEDSGHKKDNSNNWGRAPSLPIILELNMPAIDSAITEKLQKKKSPSQHTRGSD